MPAMAAVTLGVIRAVTENQARSRRLLGPWSGPAPAAAQRLLPTQCSRGTVPAAQPGLGDHRRRNWGAERGQLYVQAPNPGVAVGRGLLGVAVDLTDRAVD